MPFELRRSVYALSIPCLAALLGCNSGGSPVTSSTLKSCKSVPTVTGSSEGPYLLTDGTGAQQQKGFRRLQAHIPRAVSRLADDGKLAEDREIPVTVALNLNHESELDQRLSDLYRPGSPGFHRFLTPAEFQARYSPTEEQVTQVKAYLQSQGVQPESVSDNRLLVRARGKVGALNALFHTEVHQYKDAQGQAYFAPAYELQVPAGMPIQSIHGLQNVIRLKSYAHPLTSSATAHGGTGPSGGFTPSDIRTAYRVPSNLNGAGQTLAVFELDGYSASDVAGYEKNFNLPSVPLQNVLVDGAGGSAGGGAAEVTLDIELMIAIAPGASKILVYEGPNSDQGVLDTYAKIASDNLAREVSTSWGTSEDGTSSSLVQAENNIFKQMAAQGQSIYAAAGDNGALDNGTSLSVDDPGSQPYVVGVGGTKLFTASSGAYDHETTWNADGNQADGAGGGGISTLWSQPSWQQGLATSQNLASSTMRNVPDVALNADPATGYSIYVNGGWAIFGGTSCAAPLWAAFTALVNQQRAANGMAVLGFANPALYQVGRSTSYASDFFDIADGSTNIHYPAVSGYDDATGWGSFNGQNLLRSLSQDPAAPVAGTPATGSGPTASGC